jgi:hypothetical protein
MVEVLGMSLVLFWVCAAMAFLYLGAGGYIIANGLTCWPAIGMAAFFIVLAVVHSKRS